MEVIKCNTEVAMETTEVARNSKTKSKMAESQFASSDEIAGFQCHAIQNKNQNHSIDKVQILRKERR